MSDYNLKDLADNYIKLPEYSTSELHEILGMCIVVRSSIHDELMKRRGTKKNDWFQSLPDMQSEGATNNSNRAMRRVPRYKNMHTMELFRNLGLYQRQESVPPST